MNGTTVTSLSTQKNTNIFRNNNLMECCVNSNLACKQM
jgi:hypothetical protein